MKTYQYAFTAGETKTFPAGSFIFLIDTSSPVDVEFFKNNQNLNVSAQDVESGYYADFTPWQTDQYEHQFHRVEITSALAQTITVGISTGIGGYNRTTLSGEVDVNGKVSTNGKFYSRSDSEIAGGGGRSWSRLSNVAGSGVTIAAHSCQVSNVSTADVITLGEVNSHGIGGGNARNLVVSSTSSNGKGVVTSSNGSTLVAVGNQHRALSIPAAQLPFELIRKPIIIAAGESVAARMATVGLGLTVCWEWEEY